MTRPSSSLLSQPLDKPLLVDASERVVPLGDLIGAGGEGKVFTVQGAPGVAAKVYHKNPLGEAQENKLRQMVKLADEEVLSVAAWPRGLLLDPQTKRVRGVMMLRVADAHELHELYGTTARQRFFPQAHWSHLVLAARNAAAAFATMHARGVVIGDVNQGNLMVDAGMCARFIDCDSFQVKQRGHTFRCPVGTPHFTPPELQAVRLADVDRTPNHDAFGLAVLIFHLLFVGRHPFAGRFRGEGDMTIERAIAEHRFAFSRDRDATQVDPPPATLRLEDLPASTGNLFERAFRAKEGEQRPKAEEWVTDLEAVLRGRQTCPIDESHTFPGTAQECPWCRIEDAGGPAFFLNVALVDGSSESRLVALEAQLERLGEPEFPHLPSSGLKLPRLPLITAPKSPPPKGTADWLADGWFVAAITCVAGFVWWPVLAVGALGSLATGGLLAFGEAGKTRRRRLDERDASLDAGLHQLADGAAGVLQRHNGRRSEFDAYRASVRTGMARFRSDTEDLDGILAQLRTEQKEDFLRGYTLRDYRRKVPGLTPPTVAVLESFGIDSAYHVQKDLLTGVPTIGQTLAMELLAWRERVEERYEYVPEEGCSERELNANRQEAMRRFKLSLARKLVQGAKRLRAMASSAESQADRELAAFKTHVTAWREQAKQRQAEQAARRPWERRLNSSLGVVVTAAVAPVFVGLLGWLVFGG